MRVPFIRRAFRDHSEQRAGLGGKSFAFDMPGIQPGHIENGASDAPVADQQIRALPQDIDRQFLPQGPGWQPS